MMEGKKAPPPKDAQSTTERTEREAENCTSRMGSGGSAGGAVKAVDRHCAGDIVTKSRWNDNSALPREGE